MAGMVTVISASVLLAGSTEPAPCATKSECRQLDFWIGEWDVATPDGKKVAVSRIQLGVGQCVVLENYSDPSGYEGKSINFFDSRLGKWRQTWADSAGGVSEFTGELKDGAMQLEGETHRADGEKVLRKMRISKMTDNRVRQYSELSTDDGKTWSVAYDLTYLRRVRSAEPSPK